MIWLDNNKFSLSVIKVLNLSYYPVTITQSCRRLFSIVSGLLWQVTVVNPAMESALLIVQKFAFDAYNGKVSEDRLHFGAPWRHPPRTNDPVSSIMWAKIQLIDFVQSLVITEFGVRSLLIMFFPVLDFVFDILGHCSMECLRLDHSVFLNMVAYYTISMFLFVYVF